MSTKVPVIGITGAIGSGKSAFAKALAAKGAVIIDADLLAREVVVPGSPALIEIGSTFGAEILLPDGTLNRQQLGRLIFNDPAERKKLEQIVHPRVRELFLKRLAEVRKDGPKLIAYVVPLLFESGYSYNELEAIVVVAAPREVCISRIVERDGLDSTEAERRLDAQLPIEQKISGADCVVHNTGELSALEQAASEVFKRFSHSAN